MTSNSTRPPALRDGHEPTTEELNRSLRRRFRILAGGLVGLTFALNVAPVAANHLSVKSSDIVNGAVTTPKLADNAVKEVKINDGAVSTLKIRDGAVTGAKIKNRSVGNVKIARDVPGIAVAGVQVSATGNMIFNSFNRFGGAPVVTKTGTGVYDVVFPGLEERGVDSIAVATVYGATPGVATHSDLANGVKIRTFDMSGTPMDLTFNVSIVAPAPVGAVNAAIASTKDADVAQQ